MIIQIAKETQDGIAKVYGRIKELNIDIKKSTVRTIMRRHGFPPKKTSNDYDPTWSEFLKSHRETLLATDFFTVEVWNKWLLKTITYFVLVFIHHGSRKMWIGGITTKPTQAWTTQIARNFVYNIEDKPKITYLIHDADWCLRGGLEDVFKSEGIKIKRGSCRTNSMFERMNQTIKHECTNRLISIGENSLRKTLKQFQNHYNFERPYQGIDNKTPDPFPKKNFGKIQTRYKLGGLLKYYYRSAT